MNLKQKIVGAAGAVSSVFMTGVVMAQTSGPADLAAAVTGEMSEGKAQLYVIGGVVVTLAAVCALIGYIRRAAR